MKLIDAEQMCISLMRHHGVYDYTFKWMKRMKPFSAAGYCSYKRKLIMLAPVFVELNYPVVVKWTILHEIAHALRPRHHHNKYWKQTAKDLGHSGERCYGGYVKRW